MQLNHYTSKFSTRTFPIVLICDNVSNAANIGSLFRTADAFGVQKIIFCGSEIPMGRKMTRTSRATENYVNFEIRSDVYEILQQYKEEHYHIVALEITTDSTSMDQIKLNGLQPVVILVGDENFGISESCLELADEIVHIEMFGKNSSMNVVQATTIALYEITKKL